LGKAKWQEGKVARGQIGKRIYYIEDGQYEVAAWFRKVDGALSGRSMRRYRGGC
jgi:hypothetical protein